jgi:CRP-like cAMP-binding protein
MKLRLEGECLNKFELTENLLKSGIEKNIIKGDYLYEKGGSPSGVYYILDGVVGLINLSMNGNESLLRVFSDKFFIGYRSFLSHENYHATALALTDLKVLFIPIDNPESLLKLDPSAVLHISQMLSRDLRISEERFNDITGKRAINRIIESLIFLKQRQPNHSWTRREIGEFCGAKTETVTRVLTTLEKEKLIKKDGRIISIVNIKDLLDYSENLELNQ